MACEATYYYVSKENTNNMYNSYYKYSAMHEGSICTLILMTVLDVGLTFAKSSRVLVALAA